MNRRLPDNLALLYAAFDVDTEGELPSLMVSESFTFEGIEFVCDYRPESTRDRFFIIKPRSHVDEYLELLEGFRGANIMELGIAEGGSTALTALAARPRRLVAIDIETERLVALDEFLDDRGLHDMVKLHWGVDQSDAERLHRIVAEDLEGEPLDLVVDDASHQLDLTRASFDALFPLLRPGGLYVIEDWNNDHLFHDSVAAALRDPSSPGHEEAMEQMREALAARAAEGTAASTPTKKTLSRIAFELVLARASSGDAVAEVRIGGNTVTVRRGPGDLDPASFRLRDLYRDHFGLDPSSHDPA